MVVGYTSEAHRINSNNVEMKRVNRKTKIEEIKNIKPEKKIHKKFKCKALAKPSMPFCVDSLLADNHRVSF